VIKPYYTGRLAATMFSNTSFRRTAYVLIRSSWCVSYMFPLCHEWGLGAYDSVFIGLLSKGVLAYEILLERQAPLRARFERFSLTVLSAENVEAIVLKGSCNLLLHGGARFCCNGFRTACGLVRQLRDRHDLRHTYSNDSLSPKAVDTRKPKHYLP
jgi:hypothetical protein